VRDDIVPAKTLAASSTMICLQAPWSRAEMIFVTPTRETACIPLSLPVFIVGFVCQWARDMFNRGRAYYDMLRRFYE
jgi:hypothetical protein